MACLAHLNNPADDILMVVTEDDTVDVIPEGVTILEWHKVTKIPNQPTSLHTVYHTEAIDVSYLNNINFIEGYYDYKN